jgi:hypothetical protein
LNLSYDETLSNYFNLRCYKKVHAKSFMEKYWMYIVPGIFLTMNVLTGDQPPPKQKKK